MPRPRKALISLDATSFYHCSSRCVRRAYLCGKDKHTGVSYEHRRQWIEDRLLQLATIFSIDVAAFAIMSNHYHTVLHVDRDRAQHWCAQEVVHRWHKLFKGNPLSQRFARAQPLNRTEMTTLHAMVDTWRARLSSISWFMRVINEGIARRSNKEDNCTGRFWEGRFDCQALLDEKALAACCVYVDLNPVRAHMATSPETSDHTSVKRRIARAKNAAQPDHPDQQARGLLPCAGHLNQNMSAGLPLPLTDYLQLVDWTGRMIRSDKRGAIAADLPPILTRLNIQPAQWLRVTMGFERHFKSMAGAEVHIRPACRQLGQHWVQGVRACRQAFSA